MLFRALFSHFFLNATCLLAAEHKFTLYGALYFMVPGVYGTVPVLATWMSNNSEPYYRRAVTIGLFFIFSSSVCYAVMYIISFSSYLFSCFSGWYHEYLEFPIQGRTKIHKNDDHMPYFVSFSFDFYLIFLFFSLYLLIQFCLAVSLYSLCLSSI